MQRVWERTILNTKSKRGGKVIAATSLGFSPQLVNSNSVGQFVK